MAKTEESEVVSELAGLLLAQQVLIEALVQHDAVGYHQLRDTLAQGLAALETEEGVEAEMFKPLRRQLALLDATHHPIEPGTEPGVRDWRLLLMEQLSR
jgi:hypothetical protein